MFRVCGRLGSNPLNLDLDDVVAWYHDHPHIPCRRSTLRCSSGFVGVSENDVASRVDAEQGTAERTTVWNVNEAGTTDQVGFDGSCRHCGFVLCDPVHAGVDVQSTRPRSDLLLGLGDKTGM